MQSETLLLECLLHWLEEHTESTLEFAKALSESGFEDATIEEELYNRGYSDLDFGRCNDGSSEFGAIVDEWEKSSAMTDAELICWAEKRG